MSENLPSMGQAKSAWSAIKAVGPLLLAQWRKASEAQAEHNLRLAQVEIYKELILTEGKSLLSLRDSLRERYYNTTSTEERLRLKTDIENLEKEARRLNIIENSLSHLPAATDEKAESEISEAWLDRFNEYAKLQNEDWRSDLLSKALAREAAAPGSIGIRALWFIGTIEEYGFHSFASLINSSIYIQGTPSIPLVMDFLNEKVPVHGYDETELGKILYVLEPLGLIGPIMHSCQILSPENNNTVKHGNNAWKLQLKKETEIYGAYLTPLGDTIAALYNPVPNEIGKLALDQWIAQRGAACQAELIPIEDQQA